MLPQRLLGLLRSSASDPGGHRLVRATRSVDELAPEALLARAPGVARGFWESGEHWTAYAGAAATLHVTVGERSPDGYNGAATRRHVHLPAERAPERFQVVRDQAGELVAGALLVEGDLHPPEPRWFGGFSFHDHHRASGEWARFPAARFVVPAFELDHGTQGTTLTATQAVRHGTSRRQARARIDGRLDRALSALEAADTSTSLGDGTPGRREANGQAAWTKAVERALHEIEQGGLDKVVLARTLEVAACPQGDPLAVLTALREGNPGTHRFLFEPEPATAFLGAAPELVSQVRGRSFQAAAVAGSIARGTSPTQDDHLARELLASEKDRAEHALVVDHIRRCLGSVADRVEVAAEPQVLRLPRIQHMETPVRARLAEGTHVLDVVEALHPTPAVCGTPRDAAKAFLREVEPFDRGWYAGPVGWFQADGDGAFAPGLRSAVLHDGCWHLYAGAGIVPGSEPDKEWEETGMKFQPVLDALGGQDP